MEYDFLGDENLWNKKREKKRGKKFNGIREI